MRKLHFGILILLIFPFAMHAQQAVTRDTIGGTPVSYTMARGIAEVMRRIEDNCTTTNIGKPADRFDEPDTRATVSTKPVIKVVPNRALTNAEICRQNPRILGYKIQLNVVKSNDEANQVKSYFRNRFPNLKVETDASLRPNYKILAGSYFSKASAAADLARIRQYFKSAIPVQYRVFCVEAK